MTRFAAVNGTDRGWTSHRYVLVFGAYCDVYLLAFANSLESALDECAEWLDEHAPGMFADDAVADEYRRLVAEGYSETEALAKAEVDTTVLGMGRYLNAWEWSIVAVDPSRETLKGIVAAAGGHR